MNFRNSLSSSGLPQLYFDQLRDLRTITQSLRQSPSTPSGALACRLTRQGLKKQSDWSDWLASEFEQLDQYDRSI